MIKAPLVGQFLTALGCVSASVGGMESAIAGRTLCLLLIDYLFRSLWLPVSIVALTN